MNVGIYELLSIWGSVYITNLEQSPGSQIRVGLFSVHRIGDASGPRVGIQGCVQLLEQFGFDWNI